MIFRIFFIEALTLFSDPGNDMVTEPRNSVDQAGDVDLNDGGLDPEEDGHEALA